MYDSLSLQTIVSFTDPFHLTSNVSIGILVWYRIYACSLVVGEVCGTVLNMVYCKEYTII